MVSHAPLPLIEDSIVYMVKNFLDAYQIPHDSKSFPRGVNPELEAAMRNQIKDKGLPAEQEKTIYLAASLVEIGYPYCSFEEKENIALFNWYLISVDDACSKGETNLQPYVEFEERFFMGSPQLLPVLDALVLVLRNMYNLYPPLFANGIVSATLDFMTAAYVETTMGQHPCECPSTRLPLFLRQKTGNSVAFGLVAYPKSQQVDFVTCYQALPDMDFWTSAANDLLSLYKETIAGEQANYISNRARAENKTPIQIAHDLVEELATSRKIIYSVLATSSNSNAVEIWRAYEYGYIVWHFVHNRYRLADIGF